ncbi:MAG: peptide chain release factor N(5)-glutamine methyltransferase [Planctomycetota bacterium]|nr:peptide chain release factor N(5)-glutamine methyltransferase [Planctomycetota bacterium]
MHVGIQNVPTPTPLQPRVWTSLDLIKWTTAYFQKKGIESPRLEAELLLADVLECPRIRLYVDFEKPVPPEKLARYRDHVKRRGEMREPVQYILGYTQFIDLRVKVTPAVLVPRPETEVLALWAVDRAKERRLPAPGPEGSPAAAPPVGQEPAIRVVDLCTGSGCLALYIASKEPHARIVATDISAAALAVAEENARTLNVADRITFRRGDLFAALQPDEQGTFDLLVANPPYVDPKAAATLPPEVRDHEPHEALFTEGGGLSMVRRIIASAAEWLKPGGWLGVELGLGQAEDVRALAQKGGVYENIGIGEDGAKLPRFLMARKASIISHEP